MSSQQETARNQRIEAWLQAGGVVIAASERAARALRTAFHAARLREGRSGWVSPEIFAWESWVRDQWLMRNTAGLVLLNPLQEQAVWARIIGRSKAGEGLLNLRRLAEAAARAFRLLCDYAPGALDPRARSNWTGDSVIFSGWLGTFQTRCASEGLISASQLPLELAKLVQLANLKPGQSPILLVGFDRLLETQIGLLDSWGVWELDKGSLTHSDPQSAGISFFAAPDSTSEIAACVAWLRERLTAQPDARLMVVTSALERRRGELERALLEAPPNTKPIPFEFSLGVSLASAGVAHSACLLLRWLHEPLTEAEVDWLITSGFSAVSGEEETALAVTMREIRRKTLERIDWTLDGFLDPHGASSPELSAAVRQTHPNRLAPPITWVTRMQSARRRLAQATARGIDLAPTEAADLAGELLQIAGWPGFRPLASAAFQARQRWVAVLERCGTLGFDGSRMTWPEFVSTLTAAVAETIFAPESTGASVQISGPLESAGQLADGIWFLGLSEESWPGRGALNPLLPIQLQRESSMPHATPLADWDLARQGTARLVASADEVTFSYPRHAGELECQPSRLIASFAGSPLPLPWQRAAPRRRPQTESFEDYSMVPFSGSRLHGGARTLTNQSLCPFQAFATVRLSADRWEPAEAGLNPRQRGQLLHAVLHRVWNPAEGGFRGLKDLRAAPDLRNFVGTIAAWAVRERIAPGVRSSLPPRFLHLEKLRLTRLVTEWLEYERERFPFTVAGTEIRSEVTIAGLTLQLRLDRVDLLSNGSSLVIDYKTGNVGPNAWLGDRPDDVQLPLYASYAIQGRLEGLSFARILPAKHEFCGRMRNAAATLMLGMNGKNGLVSDPLTEEQLADWRDRIELLAQDFLEGHAEVDPKDLAKTCDRCHLHVVCRIAENSSPLREAEEVDSAESSEATANDA